MSTTDFSLIINAIEMQVAGLEQSVQTFRANAHALYESAEQAEEQERDAQDRLDDLIAARDAFYDSIGYVPPAPEPEPEPEPEEPVEPATDEGEAP